MESPADYVQDGNILEFPDNIPYDIRQQLYDEEEVLLERYKKKTAPSAASLPPIPITITVLTVPSDQASRFVPSRAGTSVPDIPSKHTLIDYLNIPGLRDRLVKE
jgi:hypothetical protein